MKEIWENGVKYSIMDECITKLEENTTEMRTFKKNGWQIGNETVKDQYNNKDIIKKWMKWTCILDGI